MSVTQDDIQEVEEAKQLIEQALEKLNNAVSGSDNRNRYESYIKGALEQACENFTGFGGYSIDELIKDMGEEIEDTEETIKELARDLGHDDMLDDLEGLNDRLEYYENGEGDESDEEVARQCQGLMRIIEFLEE